MSLVLWSRFKGELVFGRTVLDPVAGTNQRAHAALFSKFVNIFHERNLNFGQFVARVHAATGRNQM